MLKLVRFNYLYRDGSNFKRWGSVDFSNPEQLTIEEIDIRLRSCFEQESFFIAHQIGIPELFLYVDEPITADDHCYHEYQSVEKIENEHSANPARTIGEFLTIVQTSAAQGWKTFDPLDHLSRIQARLT